MQLKTPPQNILSTLLALRDYYASLVEEYEKLYTQAKDNLNHVEALLANWPAKSSEQTNRLTPAQVVAAVIANEKGKDTLNSSQTVSETETKLSQTNTDLNATDNVETEHLSLAQEDSNVQLEIPQLDVIAVETTSSYNSNAISEAETTAVKSNPTQENSSLDSGEDTLETQGEQEETNDIQQPVADTIEADISSVSQEDNEELVIDESATVVQEDLSSDNNNNIVETEDVSEAATDIIETESSSTATENEHQQPQSISSEQENAQQTQDKQRSLGEIPMLEEYFGLSRIEAVEKLLQKHPGNICHVDFVARALYGELEPSIWKIVRGRVQSTLTQGKNSGRWFLVPGKSGYYTINLKLLKSNRKSSSSQPENKKKPSLQSKANAVPMVGEFEGKFVIDALTTMLQQNPGKVFNVAQVIEALYGELDPDEIKEVKTSVLNELSRGHRTGIFSRVPGEKGVYTWDVKLLSPGK
ncbi:hypothetical protein [Nostoc sp. PCC 7120 = FACHB-418]|uniref:hypothetical protein n=1 Tax=Nostoc sp. (strain PCC 7120 / SAG 25.82 / UTEX 2576) TaxID=103690 RepID=UPI00000CEF11|nr:hypothetical protein [Nostoc sp. PCC 7120 = FACHB-418]BAB78269.1 all7185 [Nostoc sp. PCC 7120 = FACHB-418]